MFGRSFVNVAAVAGVIGVGGLAATSALAQITIPTVPIGNPGNVADVIDGDQNASGVQRLGSVAYAYNIGTTEVTNAQYAAFLNAKAATDTFVLYNFQMSGATGGITRSGSPGSYTYATVNGRANNPVNFVSFWDACRFANWLHNGQGVGGGSGDTETGAYTLTAGGISANTITRNAGWQWAVTNENEWYKAAYHQLASEGGDSDNYWLYPTSSNDIPTTAQVNYGGAIGNTRPVGSYAANFYGAFDMGGNVSEWNESRTSNSRNYRGGAFAGNNGFLQAVSRTQSAPSNENVDVGFRVVRVAVLVPTPCTPSDVAGPGQSVGADGQLTADDIIVFLNWFFAGDLRADVAGPGQGTVPDAQFSADDIIVFLNRFFAGC